jgi:hypothetical protein
VLIGGVRGWNRYVTARTANVDEKMLSADEASVFDESDEDGLRFWARLSVRYPKAEVKYGVVRSPMLLTCINPCSKASEFVGRASAD